MFPSKESVNTEIIHTNCTCDALCDLVPFAQFEKCEKHQWGSATFSNLAGFH